MFNLLASLVAIFFLLFAVEAFWRKRHIRQETSRKIIHIIVGVFIASWPFFMSFTMIRLVSLAFLAVILLSRYFHILKSIHNVDRHTWGDLLFPVGVGLSALLTNNKYVFAAAILHLGIADGLAALVGSRFTKKYVYSVFEQRKSWPGTLTFWASSVAIMIWFISVAHPEATIATMALFFVLVPIITSAVENLAVFGFDNLFVPVLIVVLLGSL